MSEKEERYVPLAAVWAVLEKFLALRVVRDIVTELEGADLLVVPAELFEKLSELQKALGNLLEEKTRSLDALTNDHALVEFGDKSKRALKLYRLLEAVHFLLSQAGVDSFTLESVVTILQQVDLRSQQREALEEIRALAEKVKGELEVLAEENENSAKRIDDQVEDGLRKELPGRINNLLRILALRGVLVNPTWTTFEDLPSDIRLAIQQDVF